MKNNKGIIVKYKNSEGRWQKAKVLYADQKPEFSNFQRVFVRLIDDDFEDKIIDGKKVIGVKHEAELKLIGFID